MRREATLSEKIKALFSKQQGMKMNLNLNKAILAIFFFSNLVLTGFLQAQSIVIKAGHLFNSRTGKILNDQTIIIKNGKIQEVGSNLKYKSTDTVIDLSKSWVLPGLMDCHVHLTFNFSYGNPSYEQIYNGEQACGH